MTVVRRVERAAEEAGHCHSKRLLADLDLVRLCARRRLERGLELLVLRRRADDAEAAIRAQIR